VDITWFSEEYVTHHVIIPNFEQMTKEIVLCFE